MVLTAVRFRSHSRHSAPGHDGFPVPAPVCPPVLFRSPPPVLSRGHCCVLFRSRSRRCRGHCRVRCRSHSRRCRGRRCVRCHNHSRRCRECVRIRHCSRILSCFRIRFRRYSRIKVIKSRYNCSLFQLLSVIVYAGGLFLDKGKHNCYIFSKKQGRFHRGSTLFFYKIRI